MDNHLVGKQPVIIQIGPIGRSCSYLPLETNSWRNIEVFLLTRSGFHIKGITPYILTLVAVQFLREIIHSLILLYLKAYNTTFNLFVQNVRLSCCAVEKFLCSFNQIIIRDLWTSGKKQLRVRKYEFCKTNVW